MYLTFFYMGIEVLVLQWVGIERGIQKDLGKSLINWRNHKNKSKMNVWICFTSWIYPSGRSEGANLEKVNWCGRGAWVEKLHFYSCFETLKIFWRSFIANFAFIPQLQFYQKPSPIYILFPFSYASSFEVSVIHWHKYARMKNTIHLYQQDELLFSKKM